MSEHASALKRFFSYKLPRREDAEDAFSVTLFRIWNYLTASEVESVSGLIFTIARSVVAEFYRSRKIETVPIEGHDQLSEDQEGKFENWMDVEIVKKRLVEMFNEDEQLVFQLRFFEGLTIKEVAKKIQKSENATRVMLHRLLKRLRAELTKNCDK
jgi:RNA polymerase sigma-70 factor (ECF subfamily)